MTKIIYHYKINIMQNDQEVKDLVKERYSEIALQSKPPTHHHVVAQVDAQPLTLKL